MMIDPNHPFFAKRWRRLLAVAFPIVWGFVELALGNTAWAAGFVAVGAYAGWVLLLKPRA
jgi:hypothetical protein